MPGEQQGKLDDVLDKSVCCAGELLSAQRASQHPGWLVLGSLGKERKAVGSSWGKDHTELGATMFCGVVSHLSVSWMEQLCLLSQARSRLQVSRPLAIPEEVRVAPQAAHSPGNTPSLSWVLWTPFPTPLSPAKHLLHHEEKITLDPLLPVSTGTMSAVHGGHGLRSVRWPSLSTP